ncbi:MAG: TonB-dependent receptor, partial [Thermoanaerobaculia bacterium]
MLGTHRAVSVFLQEKRRAILWIKYPDTSSPTNHRASGHLAGVTNPGDARMKNLRLENVLAGLVVCGIVLAVMALGVPAFAQEADSDEAEESVEGGVIDEVITVTARKREETLQEVPFSIVAPTEDVLRALGAQNLEDVSANVGGFTVQNLGPGQSQIAMRGVSSGQIVRDQPGVKEQVGVYLDESVISLSLYTPDLDLFDMSRIEVLRGPQGTLFGSGSASGTVRYISNQPLIGVSESVAEFTAKFIDDGEFGGDVKVAVNAPLGDTAAVRVVAYYTSFGGYMDAVQPDLSVSKDVNSGDRTGVRVAIRSEPNDRLTITPRILYQELDMDGWNRIDDFNILANPFTTTRPTVTFGERQLFTQLEEKTTDEFLLADLNIQYLFGDVILTSITSYTDRDILVVRDATALTASITGGTIPFGPGVYTLDGPLDDATTVETITQELRLSGVKDRATWVAGVFYSTIDRDYGQSLFVDGFEAATVLDPLGPILTPTAGSFGAGTNVLFFSDLSYEFDQFAVFGELTYQVNDRFNLTGGLRYYDFTEDRVQTFDGVFAAPGTTLGSTTADGFAPRIIASYRLNDNTQLNAQISKGFRLGGINDP